MTLNDKARRVMVEGAGPDVDADRCRECGAVHRRPYPWVYEAPGGDEVGVEAMLDVEIADTLVAAE